MIAVFEEIVSVEDWRQVLRVLLARAKAGDIAAFRELAPWIVGRVPEEVKHEGATGIGAVHIYLPERGSMTRESQVIEGNGRALN